MTMPDKDLVFIVSGGRTATQFLGDRVCQAITDSYSEHEPDVVVPGNPRSRTRIQKFGLFNSIFGKLVGRRGIRAIGTKLLKGQITPEIARKRLKASRIHFHSLIDQKLIIESNGQWNYACDEIQRIWPEAKIAIIIRDPRTWIRSWLNKGTRWTYSDMALWLPPGRPTPQTVGDRQAVGIWKRHGIFGRLAWEWAFTYGRLDRLSLRSANVRVFRFEDLFNENDHEEIRNLISFCADHHSRMYPIDIPANFTSQAQNASRGAEPRWTEWPPYRAQLVDQLCGKLMTKYGYGTEASWKKKLLETRDHETRNQKS